MTGAPTLIAIPAGLGPNNTAFHSLAMCGPGIVLPFLPQIKKRRKINFSAVLISEQRENMVFEILWGNKLFIGIKSFRTKTLAFLR